MRKKKKKPDMRVRRTRYLRLRATEEQHVLLHEAARWAGVSLSAWAIERLMLAARREIRE